MNPTKPIHRFFFAVSGFILIRYFWILVSSVKVFHPENTAYVPFHLSPSPLGWPQKLLDACSVDSCLSRVRPVGHLLEWIDAILGAWIFRFTGEFWSLVQILGFLLLCFALFRLLTTILNKAHLSEKLLMAIYPLSMSPILIQSPIFFRPGKTWVAYLLVEGLVQIFRRKWLGILGVSLVLPFVDELGSIALLLLAISFLVLEPTKKKFAAFTIVAVMAMHAFFRWITPSYTQGTLQEFSSFKLSFHIREVWYWLEFVSDQWIYQFSGLGEWGFWAAFLFPVSLNMKHPLAKQQKRMAIAFVLIGAAIYYVLIQRHPPLRWDDVQRASYYTLFLGITTYLAAFFITRNTQRFSAILVLLVIPQTLTFNHSQKIALEGHLAPAVSESVKLKAGNESELSEPYQKLLRFLRARE